MVRLGIWLRVSLGRPGGAGALARLLPGSRLRQLRLIICEGESGPPRAASRSMTSACDRRALRICAISAMRGCCLETDNAGAV
jgi:hypothetical protein